MKIRVMITLQFHCKCRKLDPIAMPNLFLLFLLRA